MPAYDALFPMGTRVRIIDRDALESFRARWHWHHPVTAAHLARAGEAGTVTWTGYYHGGDPLYALDDAPDVWHEECLVADRAPAV